MKIIPLDESPITFKPSPGNPTTKKLKNSVVVFSRKNSPKAILQIRMNFEAASGPHVEVVNVHLSGAQARMLADALVHR